MSGDGVRGLAEVQPLHEAILVAVRGHIRAERDGHLTEVCTTAALAWFDARLGSSEVVEAVAEELRNLGHQPPPPSLAEVAFMDASHAAAAAVEAVRSALREGQ